MSGVGKECVMCMGLFPHLANFDVESVVSSFEGYRWYEVFCLSFSASLLAREVVVLHSLLETAPREELRPDVGFVTRYSSSESYLSPAISILAARILRNRVSDCLPMLKFQRQNEDPSKYPLVFQLDASSMVVPSDFDLLPEAVEPKKGQKKRKDMWKAGFKGKLLAYLKGGGESLDAALRRWADRNGGASVAAHGTTNALHPVIRAVGATYHLGGFYNKYARNVPQTEWVVRGQSIGCGSVEAFVATAIVHHLGASANGHALGSSGREDRNVRMVGSGRPFWMCVKGSFKCPLMFEEHQYRAIEEMIRVKSEEAVRVKGFRLYSQSEVDAVNSASADKVKVYRCAFRVDSSVPLEASRICEILNNCATEEAPLKILQDTPIRVLHRRSPIIRPRYIFAMKVERVEKDGCVVVLHLETSAGTYIKELVHGDLGRTCPSISSILGASCTFLALDVTAVRMDQKKLIVQNDGDKEEDDEDE